MATGDRPAGSATIEVTAFAGVAIVGVRETVTGFVANGFVANGFVADGFVGGVAFVVEATAVAPKPFELGVGADDLLLFAP